MSAFHYNLMLLTDSYKHSHWRQYPPDTQGVYSYFEARTPGEELVPFGLQYWLQRYLAGRVVDYPMIEQAERVVNAHMGGQHFNREGWLHILRKHDGYLPLRIKALPEGTPVTSQNVLMTVENTDPACFWLTNFVETLLVQTWYPTTVASRDRDAARVIKGYLEETGDPNQLRYKLHDFGFRGVTSPEHAAIGGAAHLIHFSGTDTLVALPFIQEYYDGDEAEGSSIPAAEHSTITSWGRDGEGDAFENMLDQYPEGYVAVVSDSFDIDYACRVLWGSRLKDRVRQRNGKVIIRPDSGDPTASVVSTLETLAEAFGFWTNAKGYFELPAQLGVIQGDGIEVPETIEAVYSEMASRRWSANNVAFGSGGGLLQKVNRDTFSFAFKCSAINRGGVWHDVFKRPTGDPSKASKRGRLALVKSLGGQWSTERESTIDNRYFFENKLVTVFENGFLRNHTTWNEVKARAAL